MARMFGDVVAFYYLPMENIAVIGVLMTMSFIDTARRHLQITLSIIPNAHLVISTFATAKAYIPTFQYRKSKIIIIRIFRNGGLSGGP